MEFHRLQFEQWYSILRAIGCVIFLALFILLLLRVIFMPKSKRERAVALPLENEKTKEAHANGDKKRTRF